MSGNIGDVKSKSDQPGDGKLLAIYQTDTIDAKLYLDKLSEDNHGLYFSLSADINGEKYGACKKHLPSITSIAIETFQQIAHNWFLSQVDRYSTENTTSPSIVEEIGQLTPIDLSPATEGSNE